MRHDEMGVIRVKRLWILVLGLVCVGLLMAATAAVALADDIPGVPLPASPVQGYLDNSNGSGVHTNDVYNFSMRVGDRFYAVLNADSSTDSDYDLQLFAPGSMGVFGTTPLVDVDPYAYNPYPKTLNYTATAAGLYYLNVAIGPTAGVPYSPADVSGAYSVAWTCKSPTMTILATRSHAVSAGRRVSVKGSLTYAVGGDAIAGATIRLQSSTNDKKWKKATTTTTNPSGAFILKVKVKRSCYYRAVFAGTSALIASKSLAIHLRAK